MALSNQIGLLACKVKHQPVHSSQLHTSGRWLAKIGLIPEDGLPRMAKEIPKMTYREWQNPGTSITVIWCHLWVNFLNLKRGLDETSSLHIANNFGLMYSRKRISQNSIPNFIYIFQSHSWYSVRNYKIPKGIMKTRFEPRLPRMSSWKRI